MTAMVQSGDPRAMGWSPYTEWYENSLRFPDSPVAEHHRATYGDKPYREFAAEWEAGLASWDPDEWARTFAAAGRALRGARDQAPRRVLPVAVDGPEPAPAGLALHA